MSLSAGERLGPYEIVALIGAGGMGEVYRARDTRLHRTVAIKVVRPEFSSRDDFRVRFQRESRAISAVNHPHICSLYDIGEQNGLHYLVMEFVQGESLDQALRRGTYPLEAAARHGTEIAEALKAAHAQGIIHRDLKPANIMISEGGIKVLDFGLAKHFESRAIAEGSTGTMAPDSQAGTIVGTLAYMSPEQAEGLPVDGRSDIFALGVVLYEMLCGRRPFHGDTTLATLASILRENPPLPRQVRPEIPVQFEHIVQRCLAKKPVDRYSSAAEVAHDLEKVAKPEASGIVLRRPVVAAIGTIVLITAAALGTRWFLNSSRERTAETETIPRAAALLENSQPLAALRTLQEAEKYAPASAALIRLREDLPVLAMSIESTPSDAEVYATDYADPKAADFSHWIHLGRTPLTTNKLPRDGFFRIRLIKDGYGAVEMTTADRTVRSELHKKENTPEGMIWIPLAPPTPLVILGVQLPVVDIPAAWMDKNEVTNRQFKQFVDAGGYQKREYWKPPFMKDGKVIPWEQAITEFHDAAGKPGPSTWEGTYPDGTADVPVGGVSWYEAAAYAEFAGRSLPTVYHWYMAAGIGLTSQIIPWSNFDRKGPVAIGSTLGLGPYGNYDMAGNLKEWTVNNSGEKRFILGGGWNEPSYMFQQGDTRSPWDREAMFGFRCALYAAPLPETLNGPVVKNERNRTGEPPVDDRTFEAFKNQLSYDRTDLKATKDLVKETTHWRREDISFQAGYGDERVILHLYLPKDSVPPYQAVFFSAGGNMRFARNPEDVFTRLTEWIIKSGRAIVLPAYAGTLDRGPTRPPVPRAKERDLGIQSFKDAARTIDYLETRGDIDTAKLAFSGMSFGAGLGLKIVTVETRFKAAVLLSLGYTPADGFPEVDSWNYAPRVKIPILMLNGLDDSMAPVESAQIPMFNALGTPAAHKRRRAFVGGHADFINRQEVIDLSLGWLDRYLGPVNVSH